MAEWFDCQDRVRAQDRNRALGRVMDKIVNPGDPVAVYE